MTHARPGPGPGFYAALVVIGFATFAIHEAAHWTMGEALGHDMVASLNGAYATSPTTVGDQMLISGAGPAVTALQAVVALALVLTRHSPIAYGVLFWAAFMRLMATVVSLFNPNDEARISVALGWGSWPLPVIVTLGLVVLTWLGSRHLNLSWKTNALAYGVASATVAAIVGLDALIPR